MTRTLLDLAQQIGQMVVMAVPGRLLPEQAEGLLSFPGVRHLQNRIQSWGVGGILMEPPGMASEVLLRIQQLQSWAALPLWVGTEMGSHFEGMTPLPPWGCLQDLRWDPESTQPGDQLAAQQLGFFAARELKAMGMGWILGIPLDGQGSHTWEQDPARLRAYVQAAQKEEVLGCGRVSQLTSTAALQAAKKVGIGGIQVSFELLSQPHLRENLAYEGLLIADLRRPMPGDPNAGDLALQAVMAGVDLLITDEVEGVIETLTRAVQKTQVPASRVATAVDRILKAKGTIHPGSRPLLHQCWPRLGSLDPSAAELLTTSKSPPSSTQAQPSGLNRLVPSVLSNQRGTRALQTRLGQPDAWACAQTLLAQSITLVPTNAVESKPLIQPDPRWLNWIWVDNGVPRPDVNAPLVQHFHRLGIPTLISDTLLPLPLLEQVLKAAPRILFQWLGGLDRPDPVIEHLLGEHWGSLGACIFYRQPERYQRVVSRLRPQSVTQPPIPCLHVFDTTYLAQTLALSRLLGSRG